jgi:hypothetical protein
MPAHRKPELYFTLNGDSMDFPFLNLLDSKTYRVGHVNCFSSPGEVIAIYKKMQDTTAIINFVLNFPTHAIRRTDL